MSKPELLAPIQDWTSLSAAIQSGADAVFFGVKGFNMRAGAKNFTIKDLAKIAKITQAAKVKTYLTLNIIIYQHELKKVENLLRAVKKNKINAIICWDLAVIELAKKFGVKFHISTQASIANQLASNFYAKLGAERIVLARECDLRQITEIKKNSKAEVEIFAHGAMCVSVSGRCFMSQFLYGKSANRGECQQPCRREYLIKQIDGGKELELGEDYVLSPQDLSTMPFIEKIFATKIDCLKIEGRNRSPEYVATVISCYRQAIDFYFDNFGKKNFQRDFTTLKAELEKKLQTVYHRGSSSGFLFGKPVDAWAHSDGNQATQKKARIGRVTKLYNKINVAEIAIQDGEKVKVGDRLLIQGPVTGSYEVLVERLEVEHQSVTEVKQGDVFAIKLKREVKRNDEVFVIKSTQIKQPENNCHRNCSSCRGCPNKK